ncbi:MAG: hypothetical protein ACP5NW_04420 [Candidatus Woesearchaeota archaeon]
MKKIFDFDGFITNENLEARPFVEKYLESYSKESGINHYDLDMILEPIMMKVIADPAAGWNVNGKIVAPATSSEYVFYTVVLQELYEQALQGNIPKDAINAVLKVDSKKMQEMYLEAYKASATVFREGAKDFLNKHLDAAIVTNSNPAKVNEKLKSIGLGDGKIKLYGNAKKFLITEEIPGVPEKFENLFPRPIYLWRGNYKKVLDEICQGSLNATVCGDVWELDNALPSKLGYWTITLDNSVGGEVIGMTEYEKRIVPTIPNSYIVRNLEEADRMLKY